MSTFIAVEKLMEFYKDTIQKFGLHLLTLSGAELEYYIFEEADVGITTFFHPDNLEKLKIAGFIDEEIYCISIQLRNEFLDMQNTDLWNADAVRINAQWREILKKSDYIEQKIRYK